MTSGNPGVSAPINANSPGTASNAGVTPQTEPSHDRDQVSTASTIPSTTTVDSSSEYPPARPGAAAAPAPTGAAQQYTPTRTSSIPATGTTAQAMDRSGPPSPPAPQPGARPVLGIAVDSRSPVYTVPPPPKAGEPVQPASYYTPKPTAQAENSSPSPLPLPSRTTQTSSSSSSSFTPINQPSFPTLPNSTSTPYLSTYQPPTAYSNQTFSSQSQYHPGGTSGAGGGGGGGRGVLTSDGAEEGSLQGILDTAKSWMQTAGTKLAEAEAEVWRRVNSKT